MVSRFLATCAICGHQQDVVPAMVDSKGRIRACLTSKGCYPTLPDLWICEHHLSDGKRNSPGT